MLNDNGPVQLIISDYRMPGMNGVEFLRRVTQQWPDTRRVILSGDFCYDLQFNVSNLISKLLLYRCQFRNLQQKRINNLRIKMPPAAVLNFLNRIVR